MYSTAHYGVSVLEFFTPLNTINSFYPIIFFNLIFSFCCCAVTSKYTIITIKIKFQWLPFVWPHLSKSYWMNVQKLHFYTCCLVAETTKNKSGIEQMDKVQEHWKGWDFNFFAVIYCICSLKLKCWSQNSKWPCAKSFQAIPHNETSL